MKHLTTMAIIVCTAVPAFASGPTKNQKATKQVRVNLSNFAGNVVGLQVPRIPVPQGPPPPMVNIQHLKTVLFPQLAVGDLLIDTLNELRFRIRPAHGGPGWDVSDR